MKRYERRQLLERIEREGSTVGANIPEEITVQGEPLELRSFVFEIKRLDSVPESESARVEDAKRNLRRERLERKQRLEEEAGLTFEEGESIVQAIIGLDRALNALETLGSTDLEAQARAAEKAESQRWMRFLKQALGHEGT